MDSAQPAATDAEILHASRGLLVVKRQDGSLTLSWRWFRARKLLLTLLYLTPLGLLLLDPVFVSVNLITVIFGGIALGGLYTGVAQVFNSTRITVDPIAIRVSHGPVPWPGNTQLAVKDLVQLYVGFERYVAPRSGRVIYDFQLRAKTKQDDDDKLLVGGPLDLDRAKALEAVLEKHLRIVNVPVSGEW